MSSGDKFTIEWLRSTLSRLPQSDWYHHGTAIFAGVREARQVVVSEEAGSLLSEDLRAYIVQAHAAVEVLLGQVERLHAERAATCALRWQDGEPPCAISEERGDIWREGERDPIWIVRTRTAGLHWRRSGSPKWEPWGAARWSLVLRPS